MSVPQTSSIAFALIVGFLVFITVRGELPAYLATVGIGKSASAGTGLFSGLLSSLSSSGSQQALSGLSSDGVDSATAVSSGADLSSALPDLIAV